MSEAAEGYGFTLLEQSRILERFVEALYLRDIVAWVNDAAGPTVVLALAHHTDRVLGLVVGGTFGWSLKDYPMVARGVRLISGRVSRAVNQYTNFVARSMGSRLALGTRSLPTAERRHYTLPLKDRKTRDHVLKLHRSSNDPVTQQELTRSLRAFQENAVLIQFGDRDPMIRQGWHERWEKEIPNNRVYILPRVAHFTFEGAPEATVQNFREWWAGLQNRGTLASDPRHFSTTYARQELGPTRPIDMTKHINPSGAHSVPFFVPLFNPVIKSLVRVGLPFGPMTLLTVRGRKTGKRRSIPVGLFE